MVILNICKKIEPMCVSAKLGLFISNLKDCPYPNWQKRVCEEFNKSHQLSKMVSPKTKNTHDVYEHYKKHFPLIAQIHICFTSFMIEEIVSNLVCIYLDYDYKDMPMGGWDENPFDGRFCEKDYTEMIVNFLNFMSQNKDCPVWIYSSNHNETIPFYKLFWINSDSDTKLNCLNFWGNKFDRFLDTKNDYLELDYLIRAIYDEHDYDAYHLSKLYSLCQLFLENEHESELDAKLPKFIDKRYEELERIEISKLLRQMRNKVAHGDFIAFEKKCEEYAQKFMEGRFYFDYSEYSRKNWVLLNVCCLLSDAIREMINKLFDDKAYMVALKNKVVKPKNDDSNS